MRGVGVAGEAPLGRALLEGVRTVPVACSSSKCCSPRQSVIQRTFPELAVPWAARLGPGQDLGPSAPKR